MPRYYYPQQQSGIASPGLSQGMFVDPSQLHVSAQDLTNPGYGYAATTPYMGQASGAGWSQGGQTRGNDYQFAGGQDQSQIDPQMRTAMSLIAARRAAAGAGAGGALTDSAPVNAILGGMPNASALALQLRRQVGTQQNPDVGYAQIGNQLMIGGRTVSPDIAAEAAQRGVDPDALTQQYVQAENARRAAATQGQSRYQQFASQPQLAQTLEPQRMALYEAAYGHSPDEENKLAAAQMEAMSKAREFAQAPQKQAFSTNESFAKDLGVNPEVLADAIDEQYQGKSPVGKTVQLRSHYVPGLVPEAPPVLMPGGPVYITPRLYRAALDARARTAPFISPSDPDVQGPPVSPNMAAHSRWQELEAKAAAEAAAKRAAGNYSR